MRRTMMASHAPPALQVRRSLHVSGGAPAALLLTLFVFAGVLKANPAVLRLVDWSLTISLGSGRDAACLELAGSWAPLLLGACR